MQTILLVDDEYSIVEVLTHLLEEEGYTVVTAANGRDGLDRASEKVPDLVITDLMMPIMDGDELLRELRKSAALRKVPVILITSAPAPGFRDLPWADLVAKPFEFEDLLRAIRRALPKGKAKGAHERRNQARQRRRFKVKLGSAVAFTTDISGKGFSTEMMRVLPPGKTVEGKLEVLGRAVDFKGRVMWSSPGDPNLNLRGRMGVSFMDASAELLALVNSQ